MVRAVSEAKVMHRWHTLLVITLVWAGLSVFAGCSGGQRHPTWHSSPTGIERPAQPVEEEEDFSDKAGDLGVVLLVVGVTVAGVLVPLLLLGL